MYIHKLYNIHAVHLSVRLHVCTADTRNDIMHDFNIIAPDAAIERQALSEGTPDLVFSFVDVVVKRSADLPPNTFEERLQRLAARSASPQRELYADRLI